MYSYFISESIYWYITVQPSFVNLRINVYTPKIFKIINKIIESVYK